MIDKFDTLGAAKLGIQTQYLDGERHLVGHPLTGAVSAGEQFKVRNVVVLPVAVPMVDGFIGEKVASEFLGHDVAMFENGSLLSGHEGRQGHPDVSVALDVSPVFSPLKFGKSYFAKARVLAGLAARLLLSVDGFGAFSARSVKLFAADDAGSLVPLIRILSSPLIGAWHRAVERVLTVLLLVRLREALSHRKNDAAVFAGEVEKDRLFGTTLCSRMLRSSLANFGAKQFVAVFLLAESISATLANQIGQHRSSLIKLLGNQLDYAGNSDVGQVA